MTDYETIIFGGSFDPVHMGHLITARAVAQSVAARRVLLMPTPGNPLKASASTNAAQRLEMLQLAIGDDELFEVSDYEIQKTPPTYTIDTVEYLLALPESDLGQIGFVMGADSLVDLPKWRRVNDLLAMVDVLTACRPPEDVEAIQARIDAMSASFRPEIIEKMKKNVILTPMIDISSTDIRSRLAKGLSIKNLVPEAVEKYLLENKFYTS